MRSDKIILAELDIDVKALIESQNKLKEQLNGLHDLRLKLYTSGEKDKEQLDKLDVTINKLTETYNAQANTLNVQLKKNADLIKLQKALETSITKTNKTENEYIENNKKLIKLRSELNVNSNNYKQNLDTINAKIQENNKWLTENKKAQEGVTTTLNDYKKQVKDSFNQINIFNGGITGFISRAQEAGGVMPLLSSGLKGITSGIGGMTKASLSFIATPIGAIIAALGLAFKAVSSYLTGTQEGMDKLTAITRPLQSIFSALMTVLQNVGKFLVDAFSNPVESIEKFATLIKDNIVNRFTGLLELIPNLGKAIGLLFEGEFSEAAKVAADAAGKVALGTENITDKIADAAAGTSEFLTEAYNRGKKIDELQKDLDKSLAEYTKRTSELSIELDKQNTIADDTNKTFEERETAAKKAIDTATAHNKLIADRMQQEIELLRLKYQENGFTDAEKAELADLVAKRNEAIAQHKAGEKSLYDKVDAIQSEHQAKQRERRQKAIDDAIQKNKEEIDLFIAQQGYKEKSLQEQLNFEEQLSQKRLELLEREYKAGKISKTKYETDKLNISQEFLKKQAEATVAEAQKELDSYKKNIEQKIADDTFFTQEKLNAKIAENDALLKKEIEFQALKKENGLISLEEYNNAVNELNAENDTRNDEARQEREEAKKEKEAIDLENQRILDEEKFTNEFDLELERENQRYEAEIAAAEKTGADTTLIEKKHAKEKEKIEDEANRAKAKMAADTLGTMSELLGKESAAGKATALAQALINTYLGITAGVKLGFPAAIPAVAAAAATGFSAVKNITATKTPKTPKAEKGALFDIGGQRHSAGGTLFTGADGTQFEAEQGELIGVMNRNAARHFMAFNNAFPAGGASAPNYFANGGIVSRDIATPGLNTEELALKIAEANSSIPAPVVSVQDIVTEGDSYVQVRQGANF